MLRKFSFVIVFLLLAACQAATDDGRPRMATATADRRPTTVVAVQTTSTALAMPTTGRQPMTVPSVTPTATPLPSSTASPSPAVMDVQWFERNQEILGWPTDVSDKDISWVNEQSIKVQVGFAYNEYQTVQIAPDGSTLPSISPTATPFHNEIGLHYSPSGTFVMLCDNTSLSLYRVADGHLLRQANVNNSKCQLFPAWTQDESAVAFVSSNDLVEESSSVYVWMTDGSLPFIVGKIPYLKGVIGPPEWSPDMKKLAIYIQDLTSASPDTENIYYVAYLDGRQMCITGVGIAHTWSVPWLTNEIVDGGGRCCGNCDFHGYLIAETGESLPEMDWADCGYFHAQNALLSPDRRWFVVDKTNPDYFDAKVTHVFAYTLFDLQMQQPYTLSASTDTFLDFVGWTVDSSEFYLVRRPVTDTVGEQLDSPFGLLALDPHTQQFRLMSKDIRYAWLSPDGQSVFGLSNDESGFMGAIYNLDGEPLTPLTRVTIQNGWVAPADLGPIRLAWSNDSRQVAFRDVSGALWLARTDGNVTQLAAGLPMSTGWPFDTGLFWSPDGKMLLVLADDCAWVVTPPLLSGQHLTLTALRMVDDTTSWAIETNGHIVRITDGGQTWRDVSPARETYAPKDLSVLDASNAWVLSSGSQIAWQTTDGGQSWQAGQLPPAVTPAAPAPDGVEWLDAALGWRLRDNGAGVYDLEQTRDGGQTWATIKTVLWNGQLDFVNEMNGWAIAHIGEAVALLRTTDGGRTWGEIKPVVAP